MIRKQVLFWLLLPAQLVMAQGPVSLNDCQQWAHEQHPLLKQEELYRQMSEMKLKNLENNHLPQINLSAQATYQSDVTQIGNSMPGIDLSGVAKDQYNAYLDVCQNI